MKLVAAPNALKGSLSAWDAAAAIAAGARRARCDVEVVELAIADGGDGTAEVVRRARGGTSQEVAVADPLGRQRAARYARLEDGTAIVDVAAASGLALLGAEERAALLTSSYGTGQLLRAALEAGARRLVLGVGGSATVDGGAGLLQALGARLVDDTGEELPRGGGALPRLARIDTSGLLPAARTVSLEVLCDVDSPLLGELGAARLFGPQKGATPAEVDHLERALAHFAAVVARDFARDVGSVRSGGAAGGIAAGLHGVLGARLIPGAEWVLDAVDLDGALTGAALCLTAEGQLDRQTLRDKGPLAVARRSLSRGVPVAALVGGVAPDYEDRNFSAVFSICPRPISADEAMSRARPLLEAAAEQVVRWFGAATASARSKPPESWA